jgi:hypothetical protein
MAAMRETGLLALATVPFFPPRLEAAIRPGYLALTNPENLAGFPALALPVPTGQQLPASLQLIGGPNAKALLLATGIGLSGGLPGRLTCRAVLTVLTDVPGRRRSRQAPSTSSRSR